MEKQKHLERHIHLHKEVDELVADFIKHTNSMPSGTTVMELLMWSSKQTKPETIQE